MVVFLVRTLFDLYDSDLNKTLNDNELVVLLQDTAIKTTALPAVSGSVHYPTIFDSVSLLVDRAGGLSTREILQHEAAYPCP
jgi:hypothetical protein